MERRRAGATTSGDAMAGRKGNDRQKSVSESKREKERTGLRRKLLAKTDKLAC